MNYAANAKSEIRASLPEWRATVLYFLLLAGLAGLFGRGVYLQGIHDDFLQEKGKARYSRVIEMSAHRGTIYDRNGVPLAVSTPVESVWASPSDVDATSQQEKKLAQILGMKLDDVKSRLSDTSRDFVYLKRLLPPDQVEKVMNLHLPGISLQREYRRYYPDGDETAQTLGFTGLDDTGQEGMELALQSQLAGKPGSQRVIKDNHGYIVQDAGSLNPPKPGNDITLSLNSNLQHIAYRELENAVREHKAKSGAVVILDSRSGEVLALANYPSYNPNNHGNTSSEAMRNRAITDEFEPGSTLKPFTIATALETGIVTPNTLINTEHGVYRIGNRIIHDAEPESILTVAQVIQKSSNIGAAKIALSMKPEMMWQGLSDSGFGEHTGSNFPGEALGMLHDPKTWRPIEQATMAYGHGVSVNLLQLARGYIIFANNGVLEPISLLKLNAPPVGRKIFSDHTVNEVRNMLEMVVKPGGTAPLAQVAGYQVAGKTGTAHKLKNGRYVNHYIASFVGFAPASKPRLVVAVLINDPSGSDYYGGQVAAPVFSKVIGAALHALNVPNDAPMDNVIAPPPGIVKEEV